MNLTQTLQKKTLQPINYYFKEIVPLCSKNSIDYKQPSTSKTACVEELQTLFSCLKKWEYDDLPCKKFQIDYNRCIDKDKKIEKQLRVAYKDAPIGNGNDRSLTTSQFNKLMKMYPQPDLGQSPYRVMKRLPTQSYADDIFHRKHVKGKPS